MSLLWPPGTSFATVATTYYPPQQPPVIQQQPGGYQQPADLVHLFEFQTYKKLLLYSFPTKTFLVFQEDFFRMERQK